LNHLYAYAGNNPLNIIDPSGLAPELCATGKKKDNCGFLTKIARLAGGWGRVAILLCRLATKMDDDNSGGGGGKAPKIPPKKREVPTEPK